MGTYCGGVEPVPKPPAGMKLEAEVIVLVEETLVDAVEELLVDCARVVGAPHAKRASTGVL